jgi:hypothetical protein
MYPSLDFLLHFTTPRVGRLVRFEKQKYVLLPCKNALAYYNPGFAVIQSCSYPAFYPGKNF